MLLIPADIGQVGLAAVSTENGVAETEKGDPKSFPVLGASDQLLEEPSTGVGKVGRNVDGLEGTIRYQRNELSHDRIGSAAALKETFRDGLWVLTARVVKGELDIQREAISVKGEARTDPDLEALVDLFDHLVRKAIESREDTGTSPGEVGRLGLCRSHLEPATVTPLRGGTPLEVSVRKLRLSESPNVGEDVPSLVGEDLVRSLRRHGESIDQKRRQEW